MRCKGDRVYLRPVGLEDARIIFEWKNDPFMKRMSIGTDTEITLENQEKDIQRSMVGAGDIYTIICLNESDRPIGYIRTDWMDSKGYFAWLRFGLGAERGRGYAREALKLFIERLFENGAHRIDAEVYSFNERSCKLLKSLGFVSEGLRRGAYYDGNEFVDVLVMGILEGEII